MDTISKCPQCGAEAQGEEWPSGICPACFLKLGLSGAVPTPSFPDAEPKPEPEVKRPRPRGPGWPWPRWATAAAFAALGAVITWAALMLRPVVPEAPVEFRFTIPLSEGAEPVDFAVSPDGRALAYTAPNDAGETMLWLRPFDVLTAQPLSQTQDAAMPFWSPDSRHIGFFAGGKLKEIGLEGGPPLTLADAKEARGGTWSPDGVILFAGVNVGLFRVPASGGIPSQVMAFDGQAKRTRASWPQFLPGGHSFIFHAEGPDPSSAGIYMGDLASGEIRRLVERSGPGIFAEGRVLFSRGGVLMSQPLDPGRMELSGEPVRIRFVETVAADARRSPGFSAGAGVLTYRVGGSETASRLVWMDRRGEILETVDEPVEQGDFALSPDGTMVALVRSAGDNRGGDLWLLDLRRRVTSRLTFDGLGARSPAWSPDGKHITFYTVTKGEIAIRRLSTNGSGQSELLLLLPEVPEPVTLEGWSPDGRVLLYTAGRNGKQAVWMLPANGDRGKPELFLQGEFNYGQAAISPDGRWILYVSDESGRDEVYLRSFPQAEVKLQLSAGGGSRPSWRRDGREIFFVSPERMLMGLSVSMQPRIELGTPARLFRLPGSGTYRETHDGRFLVAIPNVDEEKSPIHVVINWANEK